MAMRLPYPLELEFCEAMSCPVWVLGTKPRLQPPHVTFLEQFVWLLLLLHHRVLWTPCNPGNTCSQILVCLVFSEGGKTWHMRVLPADCAPGTARYSEFESTLKARRHVASWLECSQSRPLHSGCCHWSSLSSRDTCAAPCFCQTARSHPSWCLVPRRRATAEKPLYYCLETLVLESGAESERDAWKDIRS